MSYNKLRDEVAQRHRERATAGIPRSIKRNLQHTRRTIDAHPDFAYDVQVTSGDAHVDMHLRRTGWGFTCNEVAQDAEGNVTRRSVMVRPVNRRRTEIWTIVQDAQGMEEVTVTTVTKGDVTIAGAHRTEDGQDVVVESPRPANDQEMLALAVDAARMKEAASWCTAHQDQVQSMAAATAPVAA